MDAAAISWTPTSMKKSLIKQDIPAPIPHPFIKSVWKDGNRYDAR